MVLIKFYKKCLHLKSMNFNKKINCESRKLNKKAKKKHVKECIDYSLIFTTAKTKDLFIKL